MRKYEFVETSLLYELERDMNVLAAHGYHLVNLMRIPGEVGIQATYLAYFELPDALYDIQVPAARLESFDKEAQP
jgi:hypothetical protein